MLPELDRHLSATAARVLSGRGVEVRTGTTIEKATDEGVLVSDGEFVPTRSLIWCVGVRPIRSSTGSAWPPSGPAGSMNT